MKKEDDEKQEYDISLGCKKEDKKLPDLQWSVFSMSFFGICLIVCILSVAYTLILRYSLDLTMHWWINYSWLKDIGEYVLNNTKSTAIILALFNIIKLQYDQNNKLVSILKKVFKVD